MSDERFDSNGTGSNPIESGRYDAAIYGLPFARFDDVARGRDPVEVLASQFLGAIRNGEHPEIDDYARRHPQLADEIRAVFPMVAAMEDWKAFREQTSFDHRSLESLPSGERFGNYQIVREIGRGGMGIVFEAREEGSLRRVAIKVLPFIQSPGLRTGFEREARIATELRHPHIVPVYGCGEHNGTCFYVMKLIEGVGLDWIIQRLARREGVVSFADVAAQFRSAPDPDISRIQPGPIPAPTVRRSRLISSGGGRPSAQRLIPAVGLARSSWSEIARIAAQVADALQYAHEKGTLHRDIKPANLLLDGKGNVWITDFGLAQDEAAIDGAVTGEPEVGRLSGTLRYIAPERFNGRIDARSDIYSLGVTLFELLTRRPAFQASSRQSVESIRRGDLPRPRRVNPRIPRDLEAIVIKAAAREPELRYASAAELRGDLLRFLLGHRVRARGMIGWLRRPRG